MLDTFFRLLHFRDEMVVYWAMTIISKLLQCPRFPRDKEQEYVNKQVLLTSPVLLEALFDFIRRARAQFKQGISPKVLKPTKINFLRSL